MNDIIVMATEPIPNNTPTQVRAYFATKKGEKYLADGYALVSNQFWWVEDERYSFEEGTSEYEEVCAITEEWRTLMNEYEARIFAILQSQGVVIPKLGTDVVLEPFMKKYGYVYGNGWWVKPDLEETVL